MNKRLTFCAFFFTAAMFFFSCSALNPLKAQPDTSPPAQSGSGPLEETTQIPAHDGRKQNQETNSEKNSQITQKGSDTDMDMEQEGVQQQNITPPKNKINKTTGDDDDSDSVETASDDATAYYYYTKSTIHKQKQELDRAIKSLLKAVEKDSSSFFLKKELIVLYLKNEETKKALDVARQMVTLYPDNTEGLMILAKLKQQLDQDDEAREIYQKILQLDPENENIYFILGKIYMENKNIDEAFIIFSRMAQHFPDSYVAHFFLGKIHSTQNNPDYAIKEFTKTLELNHDLVEPRLELIDIYKNIQPKGHSKKNSLDKRIVRLYKEILAIEKHNITAALELPVYYYHKGRIKKSLEMLAAFAEKNKNNHGLTMLAAKEFLGNDRFKDASIVFSGLANGAPENSLYHYLAGVAFDSLKQSEKAIGHFMKVKPDSEYYQKAILHIAFLYHELENTSKAIAFLENKLVRMPRNIDIITYLASLYEDSDKLDKAYTLLEKGIEIEPENTELMFRTGIVLDKSGKKKECIEIMKRVIALDPDNASALNYLGYTYADMSIHLDEAEALVLKAMELKPDDGFITDSVGWVYYQKGDYDKAVEYLEKAMELSDSDPIITEHLGDAYLKQNLLEQALQAYKKASSKTEDQENRFLLRQKIYRLEKRLDEQD